MSGRLSDAARVNFVLVVALDLPGFALASRLTAAPSLGPARCAIVCFAASGACLALLAAGLGGSDDGDDGGALGAVGLALLGKVFVAGAFQVRRSSGRDAADDEFHYPHQFGMSHQKHRPPSLGFLSRPPPRPTADFYLVMRRRAAARCPARTGR